MSFILLQSFGNYIDAHIAKGRLEEEGISCWLKDENTVTVNPIWTQAVGGIKLMVAAQQAERAQELLQTFQQEKRSRLSCPECGSSNIEYISSPRKAANWLGAITGFLLGNYAMAVDKTWHCFNCNAEFSQPVEHDEE